jgi:hypothetical protein
MNFATPSVRSWRILPLAGINPIHTEPSSQRLKKRGEAHEALGPGAVAAFAVNVA